MTSESKPGLPTVDDEPCPMHLCEAMSKEFGDCRAYCHRAPRAESDHDGE